MQPCSVFSAEALAADQQRMNEEERRNLFQFEMIQ